MEEPIGPDPNEGSTDPMVAEHWRLGEDFQDRIREAGYDSETVEGIAVDVHDILQASDRIREEIVPTAMGADPSAFPEELRKLRTELAHIRWHTLAAESFLNKALAALEPGNEEPL